MRSLYAQRLKDLAIPTIEMVGEDDAVDFAEMVKLIIPMFYCWLETA